MKSEQLVWFHIVLGKGPFETLLLCVRQLTHQVVWALNGETLGSHRGHTILLTFTIGVRSVPHQVESHIVSYTKTSCALGLDGMVCVVQHLITQEDGRNRIQLERVQGMFTAHVQEQVQP